MRVTIIIPWIRKEKIGRAITAATLNAGGEVLIYAKEDQDRIGCPKMVRDMVNNVQTDYVAFLGDDSIAAPGYIKYALEEMSQFSDDCGLIGFNDKTGRTLPTHWISHLDMLYKLDGEFFHCGYGHTCCDIELMERVVAMGRFAYSEKSIVLHDHPLISGGDWDKNYKKVYSPEEMEKDHTLLIQRRNEGWPEEEQFLIP